MSDNDLILYTTEDGESQFILRELGGQIWLTQSQMAELYQTTKQNISLHVQNILDESEIDRISTIKEDLTVQIEGQREVKRRLQLYALPMIIAVGYRVRSTRGTQFRQWATQTLGEYLTKGFAMNDERLKNPQWDYFDELLERIRDIRSSEKRFYQKVRDLFTLAEDYNANEKQTQQLFAEVQNKLFYAVTKHTAAELIVKRSDSNKPNMGLTSFANHRVRKADIVIAKNYLDEQELDKLNRLVSLFFDFAEFRAKNKEHLALKDWREYIDKFIDFNDQEILDNSGCISRQQMEQIVGERYETFDRQRKRQEAELEDIKELNELEKLEKRISKQVKKT